MWEPREGCLRRGEGRVENHKRRGWVTQGVRDRRSKERVANSTKEKRTRREGVGTRTKGLRKHDRSGEGVLNMREKVYWARNTRKKRLEFGEEDGNRRKAK